MGAAQQRARFDWLMELGGACTLGASAGYAALGLAPSFAWPAPAAGAAAGFGAFALGLMAMRLAPGDPVEHVLPQFTIEPIEPIEPDELLLDTPWVEPVEDDVLLLEDALPAVDPASRVVELFASPGAATPGQLKERIDQYLADAPRPAMADVPRSQPDASAALYAALDELRRSLR